MSRGYFWYNLAIALICVGFIVLIWNSPEMSLFGQIIMTVMLTIIDVVILITLVVISCESESDKNPVRHSNLHDLCDLCNSDSLESQISILRNQFTELEEYFSYYIETVKYRDYLIRTKFVGSLTNKKLIKQWKEYISERYSNFNEFTADITDFNMCNREFSHSLEEFRVLRELEEKQNILDLYTEKPKKATMASNDSKNIANKNSIKREKKDNE